MPDYSKCCVYKLCCKDPEIEQFYIGSTTNATKRKCDHKKIVQKLMIKNTILTNINLLEIMEDGTIGI